MDRIECERIIKEHCIKMSILSENYEVKKVESILDSIIASIIRSDLVYIDIIDFINDVNNDNVIDIKILQEGGNLYDYVNKKWINFAKSLFRQRSVGLKTPNVASGEGELLFLFSSKHVRKPKKGDLSINGESIELKGNEVRVMGKITGSHFRKKTLEICNKYKLIPNISENNLESVEIEKRNHFEYWKNQLSNMSHENQIHFIKEYLECVGDSSDINLESLFTNNDLEYNKLIKSIVKILYKSMVVNDKFDKFILLGDGTDVKVFSNNIEDFNTMVDNNIIKICGNFFRINQDYKIGWYIS